MMKRSLIPLFFLLMLPLIKAADSTGPELAEVEDKARKIAEKIEQLDKTLWTKEVEAQKHETVFTALWDSLRASTEKIDTLLDFTKFPLLIPKGIKQLDPLSHGIQHFRGKANADDLSLFDSNDREKLVEMVERYKKEGMELVQSEWHHSYFFPATENSSAKSTVSAELHLKAPNKHYQIKMYLKVFWKKGDELAIEKVAIEKIDIWKREGRPAFIPVLSYDPSKEIPDNIPITPMIVSDLNEDGLVDIAMPAINDVFWNKGNFKFEHGQLLGKSWKQLRAAIFADFTGDGKIDCLGQVNAGPSIFYEGLGDGKFSESPTTPWKERLTAIRSLTAGDIDGDGDLDVWAAQYKASYLEGQMPTPYYDANDGFPSYLFINDGKGNFTDETEKRFKNLKRNRRTFSCSFVDFNKDNHQDLLIVSDFSGVDIYLNDGKGYFDDATDELIEERSSFGMSHAFGNFDGDKDWDFYVVGMSSTTARRLQHLGLARDEFPEHTKMREAMTYGNRLYQRNGKGFVQTDLNTKAARAGWAWGCSTLDFNNDGFDDIYVTNGNQSGKTSKDYCSRYWCHDIYTGDSKERPEIAMVMSDKFMPKFFQGLYKGQVSWNGFEHNRLFMNQGGKSFSDVGYMMGVSLEADSRCVAAADLNNDGKKDLAVLYLKREIKQNSMSWRHSVSVFGNALETKNNWINVRLRGSSEASPVGARVMIEGKFGSREIPITTGDCLDAQLPFSAHFGLGENDQLDKLKVIWPNQSVTEIEKPKVNQTYMFEAGS